jgi:hypothetical protein
MKIAELLGERTNPDYVRGLTAAERKTMKREIKKFSKMSSTDPAAYPADWAADKEYRDRGGKIKPSKYTRKFSELFDK